MEWSEGLADGVLAALPTAALVIGPDGRVAWSNPRARCLLGYQGAELAGMPADRLIRPWSPDGTAPGAPRPDARHRDGYRLNVEVDLAAVQSPDGRLVVVALHASPQVGWEGKPALLASIVASSHDAIVSMTPERRVLTWNRGATTLYGYAEAEMIGNPVDALVPEDRRADEWEIISLVAHGARLERYRARRVCKDGRQITVSLSVSPLTDEVGAITGVAWTARDFSERERAEARFQAVLEAAPDAIVGVSRTGRIVLVNTQAQRMFGYPRHELLDQPIERLVRDGLPAGTRQPRNATGPTPAIARRRDGASFPVEMTISGLDTEDGPVTCVAIRDVTERVQAEQERARLREEAESERLAARMQQAQRLESLGQLAGGVAHDFNNLLAVILNYGTFLIEEAASPEADLEAVRHDGAQIVRAAKRGAELTHQLLAFARREVIRPRLLDLNRSVLEVGDMLRRAVGEHITLDTDLAPDLPPVMADPGQIEQVLVNLAVNARDAMPAGGRISVETGVTEVDAEHAAVQPGMAPGRYVVLRVCDSGAGMPREVIDRAFEPFFTTKPSGEGTGLGLATVYGIATQAQGTVHIYSEIGVGTTVSVLLPVAATEEPSRPVPARQWSAGHGHGETVLVVEDEPALRELTVRILASAGYEVLAAETGAAALALAEGHAGEIHLLLTDVIMPGMLGKELAEHLTTARPGVEVLYMSGYAQPVLASRGTLDPGVSLIEKPFGRQQLLAAVRGRLDQAGGAPGE